MVDRAQTLYRRAVIVGILLLFLIPIEAAVLQALSVPLATYYIVAFATAGVVLAYIEILRVRLGREGLLRLFPTWIGKWPHMRVIYLAMLGLFIWYLVGVVWDPGTLLNRVVWGELSTIFIAELFAYRIANPEKFRGYRG